MIFLSILKKHSKLLTIMNDRRRMGAEKGIEKESNKQLSIFMPQNFVLA